jgi:hypothetical protein
MYLQESKQIIKHNLRSQKISKQCMQIKELHADTALERERDDDGELH